MRHRNRVTRLFVVLMLAVCAHDARAATLPFTATLTVQVSSLPPTIFTGSGTAVSNGLGGRLTIPSNVFTGTVSFPSSLFTGVSLISGVRVSLAGNGFGSFNPGFSPTPLHPADVALARGGVGGSMAIQGSAAVNVLMLFSLNIPLSKVGSGSSTAVVSGGLAITVAATRWSAGSGRIYDVTFSTHVPNSASTELAGTSTTVPGSDSRTAGGAGRVTLVSPVRVATSAAGDLPVVAWLTVNFVPEPGTALLVTGGVATLASLSRRRRAGRGS